MTYYVSAFGYDAGMGKKNIKTEEEAIKFLHNKVKKFCKEHDIDIDDTDYCEGDRYFNYGIEERGVCIYEIHEVPEFNSKIEQLIWEAKYEIDKVCYAADDYCYSLMDNCVSNYAYNAQELLDQILKIYRKEN